MTPLERALDLSYPAFAILHQHGRFSGPQHQRVCEAILGDLRIARRQGVRGVVLEIFSRDQQVMGLLLPDAEHPELLGFDDRTMMYEGADQRRGVTRARARGEPGDQVLHGAGYHRRARAREGQLFAGGEPTGLNLLGGVRGTCPTKSCPSIR